MVCLSLKYWINFFPIIERNSCMNTKKCARNNSKLIWIYHGMHAMKHGKALFHKLSNMIAWFPRLIFCFIDNAIHSAIYTKSPTLNVLCNVENYAISCLGEIKVIFGITLSSAQFQTHSLSQCCKSIWFVHQNISLEWLRCVCGVVFAVLVLIQRLRNRHILSVILVFIPTFRQ